jgi:Undecaprenyl-phosphate glucose phosphotransferase
MLHMADFALRDRRIASGVATSSSVPPRGNRISAEGLVLAFLAIDFVIFVACGFSPWLLAMATAAEPGPMADEQAVVVAFAAALYFLMTYVAGGCNARRILEAVFTLRRVGAALAATFVILIAIGAATKTTQDFSRVWFFSWVVLSCAIIPAVRLALLANLRRRFAKGDYVFRALSIGVFSKPLTRSELRKSSGGMTQIAHSLQFARFEELDAISEWIAREEIDQIYIVAPWVDAPVILQKLLQLRQFSTEIFILPGDGRIRAHQLGVGVIGDRVALRAGDRPINGWSLLLKRAQDILVASAILLFLAPVLALVALAVKLESEGPAFFRQKRVGFNGRQFELFKFRSMYAHASDAHASRQTARNDDRVTRVGRFIRRTSLDELPQFLNVLRGDMSVVGPRPHALLTRTDGRDLWDIAEGYAARHRVKPGLTGLAQVSGCRGELDTVEKVQKRVEYDIDYIDNWSTWLDIKIILRTALLLVYDPAAY